MTLARRVTHRTQISRRQALLTAKANGAFYLRNIGRHAMFLNGRTLLRGEQRRLPNQCLVEVASAHLIFHVNHDLIRRARARLEQGAEP